MSDKAKKQLQITPFTNRVMATITKRFVDSGMSLEEFGRRMGYHKSPRKAAWQFLELTRNPRLSMVEKAAKALGVSVEDLVRESLESPCNAE
jgi:transcriptional regulator with XRE-family HTH domain